MARYGKDFASIWVIALVAGLSYASPGWADGPECRAGGAWITEDDRTLTLGEFCEGVHVIGSGNTLNVDRTRNLTIQGNDNVVEVSAVDKVITSGDGNRITAGSVRDFSSAGKRNVLVYGGREPEVWSPNDTNLTVAIEDAPGSAAASPPPPPKTAEREAPAPQPANRDTGIAPPLFTLPGPQVKLTGKMLGDLPAGYRLNLSGTYTWVSSDMTTSSRSILNLTGDGQFEIGRSANRSAANGTIGVMTESGKSGSIGSVIGSAPGGGGGGGGADSVYLKKRDGLKPEMYGTYFISGKEIELRYASGRTVTRDFATDGHFVMKIDGKAYYGRSVSGWERIEVEGGRKYRSVDGAYTAEVIPVPGKVGNGVAWLKENNRRGLESGTKISAGPVTSYREKLYGVAKSSVVYRENQPRETYLRYSSNSLIGNRMILIRHHAGTYDEDFIRNLVRYAK